MSLCIVRKAWMWVFRTPMSIPPPGTYKIRNIQHPTQLFNLHDGKSDEGTPIIGFSNKDFISGSKSMLWTLQVIPDDGTSGLNTIRLINVEAGTYAQPLGEDAGGSVVGSRTAAQWTLVPTEFLGEYAIKTTNGELACALGDKKNLTPVCAHHTLEKLMCHILQVTLQASDPSDNSQAWMFCPTSDNQWVPFWSLFHLNKSSMWSRRVKDNK
ncbi:hypothetical protein DFH29DRAFT_543192 [Suillus ampliporus]|nr:hypothetical protein DFH29DRAFT_543192 [Suillus ampliporus]